MAIEFQGTYGTMYYVRDMKKSVQYYKDKLELQPVFESPDWTEFSFSGHSLCLHLAGVENSVSGAGVLITKVKNIEGVVNTLKSKGVEFDSEIKEVHPGAYSADFVDPDGNHISLYEDKSKNK